MAGDPTIRKAPAGTATPLPGLAPADQGAVATLVAVLVAHGVYGQRNIKRGQSGIRSLFPTAADE